MSAIAGIFNMKNEKSIQSEHSFGMMEALKKYPADDRQTWNKENVFLGCHAQWITPESVGEKLPYYDQDRKLAITADAIIDNRDELLDMLQVSKALRGNMPDSKIILLAYEKWGEDCPLQLVGDFAFVIWDGTQNKLFGARDFSGSRTLYYQFYNSRFCFCTLIEPLLLSSRASKRLNENWLAEFMTIPNMIDTSDPTITPYKGIYQLQPSHTFTLCNGKFSESKYDALGAFKKIKFKTNEEYVEAFQEVLQKAVQSKVRSRKGVVAQLSGGLDSSTVASFASRELAKSSKRLTTFSYIPEKDFKDWTPKHRTANETIYINQIINYLENVDGNLMDFKGKNSYQEIDEMLEIMEMPYKFFENSFWIKGIYDEANKHKATILLNGARGNFSISWGPALDYYAILMKRIRWIKLFHEIKKYNENIGANNKSRILKAVQNKAFPLVSGYKLNAERYEFPNLLSQEILELSDIKKRLSKRESYLHPSSNPDIYQIRKNHFEEPFIWNATGTTNTKLSLRYGLWNRDPTNDIRVIKFCLSVPEEQYVQGGMDRALLRRATKDYLPEEIRCNQKIRGIQAADWLYRMRTSWGDFIEELKELASNEEFSAYFNREKIDLLTTNLPRYPRSNEAFDPNIRSLMRVLITYRFIKNLKGGDTYEKGVEKAIVRST